ncbi:transposable element Tcb1 transposase [Trichonephila clavipes]|nr:transposable element Tcb1 transposase [Trichonephila clavipes]
MPLHHFRRQYEQLSQFERGKIIGMMEAGWSTRRVFHQLGCSDCVWCHARGNRTAVEWNQVVFSDESRFNISRNDNRVRVWRPCGEHLNPGFALQQHTTPTAGVMVWDAFAYNTRSPLVLIHGTMAAQWCVNDILQSHVLTLMQRLPGAIFQQDNARIPTPRAGEKEKREEKERARKRRELVVFGKRKMEELGVLDRDADQGPGRE